MKKLVFCFLIWALALSLTFAQRSEVGVFAGGSFYMGDLNPSMPFYQTQFAFGGVYRYNLTTRWALRANVLSGSVQGGIAEPERNTLHFRSRINEFSIQAEINFLTYFTGSRHHRFSPYLFGGVGVFTFNPQALDHTGDRWIDLQPLRTEGQVRPYNRTQITFPFGLGFKFSLSRMFSVGMEWGMRKTLTDYLDDISGFYANLTDLPNGLSQIMAQRSFEGWVDPAQAPVPGSQRGRSGRSDWYSFAGITLTTVIRSDQSVPCPANRERQVERTRRQLEGRR